VLSLCTPMAKSTSSPTILGTVQHRELSISLRPISTRVFASSARCHTCTSRMHVYFPAINVDIIHMHAAAILFVLVGNCTHSCLKSAHFHTYFLCMHACDWGTTQYIFMCVCKMRERLSTFSCMTQFIFHVCVCTMRERLSSFSSVCV
jgi:hypothetical protein